MNDDRVQVVRHRLGASFDREIERKRAIDFAQKFRSLPRRDVVRESLQCEEKTARRALDVDPTVRIAQRLARVAVVAILVGQLLDRLKLVQERGNGRNVRRRRRRRRHCEGYIRKGLFARRYRTARFTLTSRR